MAIGYACIALGVPGVKLQSCQLKNATPQRIEAVTRSNLTALENILRYNIRHDIRLFRISSDIVPFASHPVNNLPWWDIFQPEFKRLGSLIRQGELRVSMHPGQYTVLNAVDHGVAAASAADLEYHARFLDMLGLDASHKIILHLGGIYNGRREAMQRFIAQFSRLSASAQSRLAVENDEKYPVDDVLEIAGILGIPAVMDVFHHSLKPPQAVLPLDQWLQSCRSTWGSNDGAQKIHYSQQDPLLRPGAHSKSVKAADFLNFHQGLRIHPVDIMLEVKDKNLSAIKCLAVTMPDLPARILEEEWDRYKYRVMEHSQAAYRAVAQHFSHTRPQPAEVYSLIEAALDGPAAVVDQLNAARHVWGYFKNLARPAEKEEYLRRTRRFQAGQSGIRPLKNHLYRMAQRYQVDRLLESYYFV